MRPFSKELLPLKPDFILLGPTILFSPTFTCNKIYCSPPATFFIWNFWFHASFTTGTEYKSLYEPSKNLSQPQNVIKEFCLKIVLFWREAQRRTSKYCSFIPIGLWDTSLSILSGVQGCSSRNLKRKCNNDEFQCTNENRNQILTINDFNKEKEKCIPNNFRCDGR